MSTPEDEALLQPEDGADRSRSAPPELSIGSDGGSNAKVELTSFDLSLEEVQELAEMESDLFIAKRILGYCMTHFRDPPSHAGERAIQRERAHVEKTFAEKMKLIQRHAERSRVPGLSRARDCGSDALHGLPATARDTSAVGSANHSAKIPGGVVGGSAGGRDGERSFPKCCVMCGGPTAPDHSDSIPDSYSGLTRTKLSGLEELAFSEHDGHSGHGGGEMEDAVIKPHPDSDSDLELKDIPLWGEDHNEKDEKNENDGNDGVVGPSVKRRRRRRADGTNEKRGAPSRKRQKAIEEAPGWESLSDSVK